MKFELEDLRTTYDELYNLSEDSFSKLYKSINIRKHFYPEQEYWVVQDKNLDDLKLIILANSHLPELDYFSDYQWISEFKETNMSQLKEKVNDFFGHWKRDVPDELKDLLNQGDFECYYYDHEYFDMDVLLKFKDRKIYLAFMLNN